MYIEWLLLSPFALFIVCGKLDKINRNNYMLARNYSLMHRTLK